MSQPDQSTEFSLESGGTTLRGEEIGEGTPVILLHGLTATRRYVVMGSKQLPKRGFRAISYDARGHGESGPAPDPRAYEYADLSADLAALLDDFGISRAVVAGALRVVPRSRPFESLDQLESLDVPVLVVGNRDEADPGHPLAVAEEYARRLPRAELLVEEEGKSPLAWPGAQLSNAIADFAGRYS